MAQKLVTQFFLYFRNFENSPALTPLVQTFVSHFGETGIAIRLCHWTAPGLVDKPPPQAEARSNASGLMPPRWLWRRVRL